MKNAPRNTALPQPAFEFQFILELVLLLLEVLDRLQEVLGLNLHFGAK